MNNNRILLATLAGGVTNFLLGWLVFGMALMPFYKSSMTAEAGAIMKDPPDVWAYVLGSLVWALLLALLYSRWATISTARGGLIAGAVIGFLVMLAMGFNGYGGMKMWNSLGSIFVDPLGNAVVSGLTGAVVGWVLGYGGPRR